MYTLYGFLCYLLEKRKQELEKEIRKESIRKKYSGQDAARCNATQDFSEGLEKKTEDDKNKIFEAIKTLFDEELIKFDYQFLWLKYLLEDKKIFKGSNQDFVDWLKTFPFDESIRQKLPKADNLKKYDPIAEYKNGKFEWLGELRTKKKEDAEMLVKHFINLLK